MPLDGLTDPQAVLLDRALARLQASYSAHDLYRNYYGGDHRLAFATTKYRQAFGALFAAFADNLCPAVVDAVADKLQVIGWGVLTDVPEAEAAVVQETIQAAWTRNLMGRRAGEVHTEALRQGDAYVLVWQDQDGKAALYPQRADQCWVEYDPETPGLVLLGLKCWRYGQRPDGTGGKWRVNVYTDQAVLKYVTKGDAGGGLKAGSLARWDVQGEAWPLSHDLGMVPLVPFPTNAGVGQYGVSELRDVIPLQDALNKSVADMLVAMEYVALPQRYATGIEVPLDDNGEPVKGWQPSVDRLWSTPATDAKFGQFDQADLTQFLKVQDGFRAEVARVSATPFHYLMLTTGDFPSGEAMKTAEQRFVSKVRDRMRGYASPWGTVASLVLRIDGGRQGVQVEPDWPDPAPKSEKDHLEGLKLKADLGVPQPVLWKEMGYTQDEVTDMETQAEDRRTTLADSMAAALNAGM